MTPNPQAADLIERVAKALLRCHCDSDEECDQIWNDIDVSRYNHLVDAKAALTAIHPGLLDGSAVVMPREPTVAMREAFVAILPDLSLVVAGYGYRAMRDAYLVTSPSPAEKT